MDALWHTYVMYIIHVVIILIFIEMCSTINTSLIFNTQIYMEIEGLLNNLNDLVDTRKGKIYIDNHMLEIMRQCVACD